VSCALGCPYQGDVPVASVVDVVERFAALGCDEIDIADTIGVGTPKRTREVLAAVTRVFPRERLSGHFHDTYGQALANIYAALFEGIEIFHASVAGLGGCPYAKGATGNVATEDVLYLMHGLGIDTGIDLAQVVAAGDFISTRSAARTHRAPVAHCSPARRAPPTRRAAPEPHTSGLTLTTPTPFDTLPIPRAASRCCCANAGMRTS
jgi:hydroxymethylglutaryl-CoA lyase